MKPFTHTPHASAFPSKNTYNYEWDIGVSDQPVHNHREELHQEHDDKRHGDIVALDVRCHSCNILILNPNLRKSSNSTRNDLVSCLRFKMLHT